MSTFKALFHLYNQFGLFTGIWTVIRVFILPYKKIEELIPKKGSVIDIGCGNGGFTNYLSYRSPQRRITGVDLSKKRISLAKKSVGTRKNITFLHGNAVTIKLPKTDCYLVVDVLHHIPYKGQELLLTFLAKQLRNNSRLIIKEVDPLNRLPFLFGHIIEKILYPKETIYERTKQEWIQLFVKLGLSYSVDGGVFYFPDSTCIFTLRKRGIK